MGPPAPAKPGDDAPRTSVRQWLSVAVLTLSTFVVVTAEMLPVGVLTPMAEGLGLATGTAGYSLTATCLATAVTAPVVPRVLGTVDRRAVLAMAMLLAAVGNLLSTLARDLSTLMLSRILLGMAIGAVWGLAAAVAERLVAPRDAPLAVSCAVGSIAAAAVAGVPLGTYIGDWLGWRAAFAVLTLASVLLALAIPLLLPSLPRTDVSLSGAAARARPRSLLRAPAVVGGLALTLSLVTAHFAVYTYVRPLLEERAGLAPSAVALLLLVYGAFGLVGNFTAGATARRRARATLVIVTGGILTVVLLLALAGTVPGVAVVGMALWGSAYGGLFVAGQIWMTRAAPHRREHISGVFVGVFTAAIALGSFAGGTVMESFGATPLLWGAASLALLALVLGVFGPGPDGGGAPAAVAAGGSGRTGGAAPSRAAAAPEARQ